MTNIKIVFLLMLSFGMAKAYGQVDRSMMPERRDSFAVQVPEPVSFELANGLKVLVVEDHSLPKVTVRLAFNRPASSHSKKGVAKLYAAMMGNGSLTMSKDMFHQRIDFVGAQLNYTAEGVQAEALSEFFPVVFRLMADGLLHPKFSNREFEYQKQRLLQDIEASQNSVSHLAERLQKAITFGKQHPYGEFPSLQSVKSIQRSDIIAYYDTQVSPKNAYMLIAGDVQVEEVKTMTQLYYGVWRATAVSPVRFPDVPVVYQSEIDFLNVPNAVQNEIAVINPVYLQKSDSDYLAALLANEILGGGSNGRLYLNLRENKGYTYEAYSTLTCDAEVSAFKAHISVRSTVVDSAVTSLLDQINKMRTQLVTQEELRLAKATVKGDFIRKLEQPITAAKLAYTVAKDSLSPDFYQDFIANIDTVSAEDVRLAAQKYFRPNQAHIIVVGNGRSVIDRLKKLTYKGQSIKINYYDKNADLVNKLSFENDLLSDVGRIYARYLKAVGGKEAVNAIKTVSTKYTGLLGAHSITLVVKETAKGQTSQEILLNNKVIQKIIFDGTQGYVEVRDLKTPFSDKENQLARQNAVLFPELEVQPTAKITGIEPVNSRMAYVVQVEKGLLNYYSVDTGLKLQTVQKTPKGAAATAYADYQVVAGVKIPRTITRSFNGKTILFKAQEISVNKNVSDTDFTQ